MKIKMDINLLQNVVDFIQGVKPALEKAAAIEHFVENNAATIANILVRGGKIPASVKSAKAKSFIHNPVDALDALLAVVNEENVIPMGKSSSIDGVKSEKADDVFVRRLMGL